MFLLSQVSICLLSCTVCSHGEVKGKNCLQLWGTVGHFENVLVNTTFEVIFSHLWNLV